MANWQLEIQDSPIEKSFLACGYSTLALMLQFSREAITCVSVKAQRHV